MQRRFGWVGNVSQMRRRQLATPLNDVDAYQAELDAMAPAELNAVYTAEIEKKRKEDEANAQRATADAAAREAAYRYNLPADAATYSYWSKASYWTLNEAIMLARGRRPEAFDERTMQQNVQISAFAGEFARWKELARRAVAMRQLHDPVVPSIFLAWAQRVELPVEPALVATVEATGVQIADGQSIAETRAKTIETYISTVAQLTEMVERLTSARNEKGEPAQKDVSTRERDSLLKLVIGMAMKGYAYVPTASRNSATSDIASDLASLGIGLDADTIRKWLKEGADLLPRAEEQDREPYSASR